MSARHHSASLPLSVRRVIQFAAAIFTLATWAPNASPASDWTSAAQWSRPMSPSVEKPHAIGSCAAGCIEGAAALAREGSGFELVRLERRRYFGHPALLAYIERLGAEAAAQGLPTLLIGDLSQARGGPMPGDHGSHQSGLDADIAYLRPAEAMTRKLTRMERERSRFRSVVDLKDDILLPAWSPTIARLLALAASDPAVDRIFVHPAIKRALCQQHGAPWLGRLRPWWGHDDHFHVRLKCPADSSACEAQEPVPAGDGCDASLDWWFSEAARERYKPAPQAHVQLPARCHALIE
jgi:penicillin-insensitive murein endopeptidase